MKLFEKINKLCWRLDGVWSLIVAVLSLLSLVQCVLGVQHGAQCLTLPCFVLVWFAYNSIGHFLEWTLYVTRSTRVKAVTKEVNAFLSAWGMERYGENENKEK